VYGVPVVRSPLVRRFIATSLPSARSTWSSFHWVSDTDLADGVAKLARVR
jgi:hypothetical protein